MRGARFQFCASVLIFEVFVVLFAALVATGLKLASPQQVWIVAAVVMVLAIIAVGTLRSETGYVIGSAVQVVLLASGFWIPTMWVLGGVFALLWVVGWRLGARIDKERAERSASEKQGETSTIEA